MRSRVARPLRRGAGVLGATTVVVTVLTLLGTVLAPAARADAFPVNPGPIVAGRPIVGTGHNLPPITGGTYDAGALNIDAIVRYYATTAPADRAAVARVAKAWIDRWLQRTCGSRTAVRCRAVVVFDIDETLLGTLSYSLAQDPVNQFNPATWDAYVRSCAYQPIPEVIGLYQALQAERIPLVLLGGGSESLREAWVSCLQSNGITGWQAFILRGPESSGLTVAEFKARERARIEAAGQRVVASIGDQVSDMAGGHLVRGFLLPNLLYYLG